MPKTKKFLTLAVATAIAGTTMLGVTSATSDYMHYQDGTISICDPSSNGTKCITMQDKNLGATKAGTGCSATDTGACGNHYQWGNNHGFEIGCRTNGCTDTVKNSATGTLAIWSGAYNHVGYVGNLFIKGTSSSKYDYWSDNTPSNHNGLRGGENDSAENNYGFDETNNVAYYVENRQGPCGEGYHVPSIGEWNKVLEYWAEENGIELEDDGGLKYNYTTLDGLKFQEDFKIPFAGSRYIDGAMVYSMGYGALLWSSSPRVGNDRARRFYLYPDEARADDYGYRAGAYSLRCFKDSYLEFPSSEGGDSEIIVNIAEFNGGQNTCSGSNYIFENIVAGTNTGTHTLSGVFQCAFGNGRSSSTVTLQLSGDKVADGDRVISGSNLMMKNSEWTVSPAGLKFANTLINTWKALTTTQTLFQKTANLIGVASGVVEVQLTVPGGTPDGTYNGVLVLTY